MRVEFNVVVNTQPLMKVPRSRALRNDIPVSLITTGAALAVDNTASEQLTTQNGRK